ncbi:MAG: hypothetical protein L3J74_00110 [Bacteroidales bacterium]|nr:hypothetical protein [Bacteroidales bacterium]
MKKIAVVLFLWNIYLLSNAQSFVYSANISNDSLECLQNISVYREFKKMKLTDNAIETWKKVYNNCPGYKKIIYQDGARFLIQSIKNEQNTKIKEKLVDSLMLLYAKRIKYFGEKDYINGRMGLNLYIYNKEKTEDAYKLMLNSVQKLNDKSNLSVINALMTASADLFKSSKITLEQFIDNYLLCYQITNKKLQILTASPKSKKILYTAQSIKKIFAANTKKQCKQILEILHKRLAAKPNDIEVIKNVNIVLQAGNCIQSALFYQTALKIDKIKPDAETAYLLAGIELEKNHYDKAEAYFRKAIRFENINYLKSKYCVDLAIMQYTRLHRFDAAQKSFEASLRYTNNPAKNYYFMAEMYAAYHNNFSKKDLEYNAFLWLSIDYYLKAKNTHQKIAKKAGEKIAYYRTYLPTKEDIFFFGLKPGQKYTIGDWVNKTTTVRVR